MLTKVCTECNVEKTTDCFHKMRSGKYGVKAKCKSCASDIRKQRYLTNRETAALQMKQYYEANKYTISTYKKHWRQENIDIITAKKKSYYESNKEIITTKQKEWRDSNKEIKAARDRNWRQTNPHKVTAYGAKRKANKLKATPCWADMEAVSVLYKLAAAATDGGVPTHVDHIVPLQSDIVCGLHCEANLQLLPASDNLSKSNRHWPDMW